MVVLGDPIREEVAFWCGTSVTVSENEPETDNNDDERRGLESDLGMTTVAMTSMTTKVTMTTMATRD